ncbi:MAG: hypothetical protein K6F32_06795 [Bacilli bacterium]|nr:hypothetical protein [Bacilli bacterium]
MRRKSVSVRALKFILAVRELNKIGYAPSMDGLIAFLQGDPAFERFSTLRTYGCLISLRPRSGKALIRSLVQQGSLKENYSRVEGEQYLIAERYEEAEEYFAKREIQKKEPSSRKPSPFVRIN